MENYPSRLFFVFAMRVDLNTWNGSQHAVELLNWLQHSLRELVFVFQSKLIWLPRRHFNPKKKQRILFNCSCCCIKNRLAWNANIFPSPRARCIEWPPLSILCRNYLLAYNTNPHIALLPDLKWVVSGESPLHWTEQLSAKAQKIFVWHRLFGDFVLTRLPVSKNEPRTRVMCLCMHEIYIASWEAVDEKYETQF